jgi:DNA polymerase III delta prime subunit
MYHELTRSRELNEKSTLSEKLRPVVLDELTLDEKTKSRFNRMIVEGNIMNMLFYGKAGTGKTSAAMVLAKSDVYDVSYFDISLNKSVEYLRENIIESAYRQSLFANKRLIILDEAEALNAASQNTLKVTIEAVSDRCRFIMITNNPEKIIAPIKSRLKPVCFDQIPKNLEYLVSTHTKTIIDKIKLFRPHLNQDEISEIEFIVKANYPDYRAIAVELEFAGY